MNRISTHVTLLLPGLESAVTALSDESSTVALLDENRLAWTDAESCPWEVSLQRALGLVAGKTEIPMARALCAVDQSIPVICADPIHLKADRDTASLVPGNTLNIDAQDAQALITSLNEFVRDDGLEFEFVTVCNWILKGAAADNLSSFPPHYLADRSISSYLTGSTASVEWRRWQTEWQMLLHSHPVNQSRVASGTLPINSLWFWGGSDLPDTQPTSALVYTDEDNAIALCRSIDVPIKSPADVMYMINQLTDENCFDQRLILDTRLLDAWMARDADQLANGLQSINNELIPLLVNAFDKGQLSALDIVTEDGRQATLRSSGGWLDRLRKKLTSR